MYFEKIKTQYDIKTLENFYDYLTKEHVAHTNMWNLMEIWRLKSLQHEPIPLEMNVHVTEDESYLRVYFLNATGGQNIIFHIYEKEAGTTTIKVKEVSNVSNQADRLWLMDAFKYLLDV